MVNLYVKCNSADVVEGPVVLRRIDQCAQCGGQGEVKEDEALPFHPHFDLDLQGGLPVLG